MIIEKNNIFETQDLENEEIKEKEVIQKKNLSNGLNVTDRYFINIKKNKVKNIFDRVCDHNGGKLIYRNDLKKAICPMHNWEINPINGSYFNVNVNKAPIQFLEKKDQIIIYNNKKIPKSKNFKKDLKVKIHVLNHASLFVHSPNFSFVTDPWIEGPTFNCGWWLKHPSPKNSYDLIEKSDFIYISHNHPDHLHIETLNKISKNKPIITPNFASGSTFKILKDLKFKNISLVNFNKSYFNLKKSLRFTFFKSGDFRDDSGLFFEIGKFKGLLNVDSNYLNFHNLPKDLTLLASSFAGGASRYPLCFDNVKKIEKEKILNQNKKSIIQANKKLIDITDAKYYLPYAGSFKENAIRDISIKRLNKKNTIEDYKKIYHKKIKVLDSFKNQFFEFNGKKLSAEIKRDNKNVLIEKSITKYLKNFKDKNKSIKKSEIQSYFLNSNFNDNLILNLKIVDDNFKIISSNFLVNFASKVIKIIFKKNDYKSDIKKLINKKQLRYLEIKVRKEAFINTVKQKMPWDDLLIGFQVRINRYPNIYNDKFWHYFSNIYIGKEYLRQSQKEIDCNSCKTIYQNLNSLIK